MMSIKAQFEFEAREKSR